jgi:hypothetical protein
VIEISQGDNHMGNAIPQTAAAGGTGSNAQADQAMSAATQQMEQLFASQMTFSSENESLKAGIQAAQSVTQPGVGG